MTIRAARFTPEVLLSAPRRSAGVPNADGSKVLYTLSTYSFAEHSGGSEVRVLDTATQESTVLTDAGGSEPNWLGDQVLMLVSGSNGTTDVLVGPVNGFANSNYTAGNIDASASSVKLAALEDGSYAIAFAALAKPDGSLYNAEKAPAPTSSGRLYRAMFVRHWDTWITPNRNAIFYAKLSRGSGNSTSGNTYTMSNPVNALKGTELESPVPPFGGTDHFDISTSGLIFVARDPDLNPATNTKMNVYYSPLTFSETTAPPPVNVSVPGFDGAASSPVFSPNGMSAAFLKMRQNGYESDKNQIFIIPDIGRPDLVVPMLATADGIGQWDRSPSTIAWSHDGQTLYLLAEDLGSVPLWSLPVNTGAGSRLPQLLAKQGSFNSIRPLSTGDVFVSGTSLVDNSAYYLVSPEATGIQRVISSNSRNGTAFGLSRSQVSEVWWPGAANGTRIHAWVFKPSTFKENATYPLAYLIHGGPQGAWEDSWSTRWNPAVFAEQGYVVVAPNPTGSTGYGQAFTDAIQNQWGGLPYEDLVLGWEYISQNMNYVDTDRAVALGASYGGYMMNWIQGHDLGRVFKALVTHDGVFSMAGQMASEELYFPQHEFGGPFWNNTENWLRWDPARFTHNWATPHLIIHSELDYRLTISEGLAAFHLLQAKGVESQFLTFPDENHWVLNRENSLLWHTVVLDWINAHVGLPKYSEQSSNGRALKREADMTSPQDEVVGGIRDLKL
ncbi:hypothetical protein H2201_000533 [Coniosporium apollinis]|uniref:Dipeptidyl-peptidase V n=2 Tax=Coniosporium TaxID=2810619 RepID=A0ABQ9P3K7_9PEZI|nr:hypothetical protein H2199_001200 [Cladosporium sp. JES 115]KAJ9669182.1 hypothetical protein H2201_000533 [Coniosporium apollinis]